MGINLDNQAHVICPNCGCELDFSNESGMHYVTPPSAGVHILKKKENGKDFSDLINKTNLDFSKFVAAQKPQDRDYSVNKKVVNDVIADNIFEDGYVKNTRGHRRFVTAQMFRMLNHPQGYTGALNAMPYKYQWEMLCGRRLKQGNELNTLAHLQIADQDAFKERLMFFNKNVVIDMLYDYCNELNKTLDEYKKKQVSIYTVHGETFYYFKSVGSVSEASINHTLFATSNLISAIKNMDSYAKIYHAVFDWYKKTYINLPCDKKKSKAWIDAYKGSGAYYTMMNLIKYHNCSINIGGDSVLRGMYAVDYLRYIAWNKHGYQLLGMLKKVIADNNFKQTW